MSEHSKGPWILQPNRPVNQPFTIGWRGPGPHHTIARVHHVGPHTQDETTANAHLVAAAPELLEVLIAVRARFQHYRHAPDENAVMDRVHEAITKATAP